MSTSVIIGAGPLGLYLAWKLIKAGVKDLVIIDPHAGSYVRPGHINHDVFTLLEERLKESLWTGKQRHIKDFEKILSKRLLDLGVTVQKKRFLSFHIENNQKGIIVQDDKASQEFVPCDFVFDCTGSKRQLVHEVNKLVSPAPFSITAISTNINVAKHFLAYVNISEDALKLINENSNNNTFGFIDALTPLEYVQSIEKLRTLGWSEFSIPRCYGIYFDKNKACLYLESPDNLDSKHYEEWVQTVINCRLNRSNVTFKQLPASKKHPYTPRFNPFPVYPMEVQQVAYQDKERPYVILNGDAQIDPNYVLAHGLKDGIERTDLLVEKLKIHQGEIVRFDENGYSQSVAKLIEVHREEIEAHYKERKQYFIRWLLIASSYYRDVIQLEKSPGQRDVYQKTLDEIQAKISLLRALEQLSRLQQGVGPAVNDKEAEYKLLQQQLIKALDQTQPWFTKWKTTVQNKIREIALIFKEIGNQYYHTKDFNKAIDCYRSALESYKCPHLADQYPIEELRLYSNTVLSLRHLNKHRDAIAKAKVGIEKYSFQAELASMQQKIMSNLVISYRYLLDAPNASLPREQFETLTFIKAHNDYLDATLKAEFLDTAPRQIKENVSQSQRPQSPLSRSSLFSRKPSEGYTEYPEDNPKEKVATPAH